jgi:peptide deformylase
MALLSIRLWPDPVLRARSTEVEVFDEDLARLASDMVATMYAAPGVGLAAPQVGVGKRLAVVDISVGREPGKVRVLVNPRILESSGSQVDNEGCLSIPDFTERVERPERVLLEAQDVKGEKFQIEAEGFEARAFCHELDHLDGVLFVDHLRGLRRDKARRFLKRMQEG